MVNTNAHNLAPVISTQRRMSRALFLANLTRFIAILTACLTAFLTLFLIASLVDDLPDFLAHDASLPEIVHYFILLQPEHLIHIIPMALLLSAMYLFSQLSRHHELIPMRAAGLSLWQMGSPLWAVGAVAVVFYAVNAEWIAPPCRSAAQALLVSIKDPFKNKVKAIKPYLAYRHKSERRDWYFENFNSAGASTGVHVTQFRPDRTVAWELAAEQAEFKSTGWEFQHAVIRRFDDDGFLTIADPIVHERLTLPDLTENPRGFAYLQALKPAVDFSAFAIARLLTEKHAALNDKTRVALTTYMYYYLLQPLGCLVALILGIPVAIANTRGSAFVNFLLALGLFASFYLVTQFFLLASKSQWLTPLAANLIPLMGYGVWGWRRMHAVR